MEADKLAAEGSKMDNTRKTIFITSPNHNYTGARLANLTQATAYKHISKLKRQATSRKHTTSNLNLARATIYDLESHKPSDERIWNATLKNRRDFSTNVRNFLWKLLHNAHKCGPYWFKMPELSERGICQTCNTPETMQHIVFNCEANQCNMIWNAARAICSKKNIDTPDLDITTIMALPLVNIKSETGKIRPGATRLLRIVISECAFQVWKLRCERLLNGSPETPEKVISPQEAMNRTRSIINSRLDEDIALTNKKRYGKEAIPEKHVLSTWNGTLQNESSLPENWLRANGVLVGIPLRTGVG